MYRFLAPVLSAQFITAATCAGGAQQSLSTLHSRLWSALPPFLASSPCRAKGAQMRAMRVLKHFVTYSCRTVSKHALLQQVLKQWMRGV